MMHIQKKSNFEIRISNKINRESKSISIYSNDETIESIHKKIMDLILGEQK